MAELTVVLLYIAAMLITAGLCAGAFYIGMRVGHKFGEKSIPPPEVSILPAKQKKAPKPHYPRKKVEEEEHA